MMEYNQRKLPYMNHLCTVTCVNNIIDGRLQCDCGNFGVYNWVWEKEAQINAVLSQNNSHIVFHPAYSSGTAALRGSEPLGKNLHHFWEMKMLSQLYGTDVLVGVSTLQLILTNCRYRFFSLIGSDKNSWGYSYNGFVQHEAQRTDYPSKYGWGSLIGVHLDMCSGTLQFFLNRKPLGIAFRGLKDYELYPVVSSTAAQSAMKMTYSVSVKPSLQLLCMQLIVTNTKLYEEFQSIPALTRYYENKYFWLIPKDTEDIKREIEWSPKVKRRRIIYGYWSIEEREEPEAQTSEESANKNGQKS